MNGQYAGSEWLKLEKAIDKAAKAAWREHPNNPRNRPRKVDRESRDPKMSQAIRMYHFWTAWDRGDRAMAFRTCNAVRKFCGLDPLSDKLLDEGYQYRNIFAANYEYARDEFLLFCYGDW